MGVLARLTQTANENRVKEQNFRSALFQQGRDNVARSKAQRLEQSKLVAARTDATLNRRQREEFHQDQMALEQQKIDAANKRAALAAASRGSRGSFNTAGSKRVFDMLKDVEEAEQRNKNIVLSTAEAKAQNIRDYVPPVPQDVAAMRSVLQQTAAREGIVLPPQAGTAQQFDAPSIGGPIGGAGRGSAVDTAPEDRIDPSLFAAGRSGGQPAPDFDRAEPVDTFAAPLVPDAQPTVFSAANPLPPAQSPTQAPIAAETNRAAQEVQVDAAGKPQSNNANRASVPPGVPPNEFSNKEAREYPMSTDPTTNRRAEAQWFATTPQNQKEYMAKKVYIGSIGQASADMQKILLKPFVTDELKAAVKAEILDLDTKFRNYSSQLTTPPAVKQPDEADTATADRIAGAREYYREFENNPEFKLDTSTGVVSQTTATGSTPRKLDIGTQGTSTETTTPARFFDFMEARNKLHLIPDLLKYDPNLARRKKYSVEAIADSIKKGAPSALAFPAIGSAQSDATGATAGHNLITREDWEDFEVGPNPSDKKGAEARK